MKERKLQSDTLGQEDGICRIAQSVGTRTLPTLFTNSALQDIKKIIIFQKAFELIDHISCNCNIPISLNIAL
jgi:hypothetical protein